MERRREGERGDATGESKEICFRSEESFSAPSPKSERAVPKSCVVSRCQTSGRESTVGNESWWRINDKLPRDCVTTTDTSP